MAKVESVLGIDYGEANIGLAFGRAGAAKPLHVISGKNSNAAAAKILHIIRDYNVDELVLGLPLTFEGKETPQSLKTRKFAKILKIKSKKPVTFIDEHSTTKKASKVMLNSGVPQKSRQTKDHYSAAVILKRYFREKDSKS